MRTEKLFEHEVATIKLLAGADLSALKDTFVMCDAAGDVIAATAGLVALGVLQNAPTTGLEAIVQISGICVVNAEEALSAMDVLMVGTAAGALIATSTDFPVGFAVEDSLISTDVRIMLKNVTVLA